MQFIIFFFLVTDVDTISLIINLTMPPPPPLLDTVCLEKNREMNNALRR